MKRKSSSSPCINDQPPMKPKTRIRKRRSPSTETPVRRTSIFRGVTRHRLSGRFEAHLWDKNNEGINNKKKKGRQVYLGAYDKEEAAARTYDLAAIKHWGPQTILNFEVSTYKTEMEEMQKMSNEEYIAFLRRKSSGFSRGVSMYRGVAKHHHNGRWEARLGCLTGAKYMYLGTFATQEEAAKAYDLAAIKHRGANAITNFDISHYSGIMDASPTAHDDPPPSEDGVASPTAHDDPPPSEDGVMELKPQEDEELLPEMQNLKFEQDNPWSLSMELGYAPFGDELGYAPFGDELDMFNDHGPEATIDSIFTKPVSNNNGCATSASSPLLASSSRVNLGV